MYFDHTFGLKTFTNLIPKLPISKRLSKITSLINWSTNLD